MKKILFFSRRGEIIVDENGNVYPIGYMDGKTVVNPRCKVLPLWKNAVVKLYGYSEQKILAVAQDSRGKRVACQLLPLIKTNREFLDLDGDFAISANFSAGENDYYTVRRWQIYSLNRQQKSFVPVCLEAKGLKPYMTLSSLVYENGVLTAGFQDESLIKYFCKREGHFTEITAEEKAEIYAELKSGSFDQRIKTKSDDCGWKPVRDVFSNFDEICQINT